MYSHQILVMIPRWNSPTLYAVIKRRIIVAAKSLTGLKLGNCYFFHWPEVEKSFLIYFFPFLGLKLENYCLF